MHDKAMAMNVTTPETAENNTEQLTFFSHGALGHPTRSTLNKALKIGHLATWPGLTIQRINKPTQENIITDKGHMCMTRQNEETQEQSTRTEPNRRRSFESTTRN